jgi:hypothetical protein
MSTQRAGRCPQPPATESGLDTLAAVSAGVSVFELARVMGTSVEMVDRTYGHLDADSEASSRARLECSGVAYGHRLGTDSSPTSGPMPRPEAWM